MAKATERKQQRKQKQATPDQKQVTQAKASQNKRNN